MTKRTEGPTIQLELATGPATPGSGGLALPVSALVRNGRAPTADEEYISDKLRTDLAIQLATAVKGEHGYRLSHTISVRAVLRMEEFVTFDREIRDKPRQNSRDQADLELFCHTMRQAQANTLLSIRQATVNRIEEVVLTPLNPPAEQKDDVVIEQRPGLLGILLGGERVTKVRRR
ncbi:MAG: hypothetical protein H3C34_19075 [Caldilineaceae bacterium]|nr:hypothetical protein [Caldilineaceae bacterium]